MKEQENIDKLAKDLLMDFEMDVPSHIWPEIELQLKTEKRRRGLLWWTSIAAGFLVLLSFFTGYWLSSRMKSDSTQILSVSKQSTKTIGTAGEFALNPKSNKRVGNSNFMVKNPVVNYHHSGLGLNYHSNKKLSYSSFEMGNADTIVNQGFKSGESSGSLAIVETIGASRGYINSRMAVLSVNTAPVHLEYPERPLFFIPNTVQTHRISIGAQYAPLIASNINSTSTNSLPMASNNYYVNSSLANQVKTSVQTYAYSCGIPCEVEISKRFGFQTGLFMNMCQQSTINISNSTFSTSKSSFENALDVVNIGASQPQATYVNNVSIEQGITTSNSNLNQNFYYIEIPMSLKYKIIDRKIGVFVQSGIISGILTKNSAVLEDQTGKIWTGKTEQMNAVVYHSTVSLGLQFSPSPRISILALPSLRYCINGYSSNNNVYNFPISFGVYTGVNIKL